MEREIIALEGVNNIAPISQAVRVGETIYLSGQCGFDMRKGGYFGDDIESQTRGALENIKEVLEAAGSDMEHLVKVNLYLKDINDFPKVNEIYKEYIHEPYPARLCYGIGDIYLGGLIEIDAIAVVK